MNENKRIVVNSLFIYLRMIIVTLISLITTRYVLRELGQSDYGLFNVVGGIVTMLNVISVGLHMTTRRYINVEMGKSLKGNLNKVFNICLVIHIVFALSVYLIALTIGLWYITNILNVVPEKMNDAVFIYFISTTVSAIGLINVPYQGLMSAFERFKEMAFIDLMTNLLKIPLVIGLICWSGNSLRFYAIGICLMSLISFICYQSYCLFRFKDITKWHFYHEFKIYKEILVFNNYTSLGAVAYLSRTQGATMIVNYFFGTLVNGAFAIAYQIENFMIMFVNNLGTASDPQITQSYTSGDYQRTFFLVERISKYSMFIMLVLTFTVNIELESLLTLWLGQVPDGALILCRWILISLLVRSINSACGSLVQASGHVKWFQILCSILLVIGLPVSWLLFEWGYPPVAIIIAFTITDFISRLGYLWLMYRIIKFDVVRFSVQVFFPFFKVIVLLGLYMYAYSYISLEGMDERLLGVIISGLICITLCLFVGTDSNEREVVLDYLKSRRGFWK